ncbi:MAG: hypothetical protein AAFS12_09680 [Cyanobacteria bacterium J06632_19]
MLFADISIKQVALSAKNFIYLKYAVKNFHVNKLKSSIYTGMAAILTKHWLVPYTDCLIIPLTISQCTSTLQENMPVAAIPNINKLDLQISAS